MFSYNVFTIYWDVFFDCVILVAGLLFGFLLFGDGEVFFLVVVVLVLVGKFLMLGLFCGLRKFWVWVNNFCFFLVCWVLNVDFVFELFFCGGGGGVGVLFWGRGGRGLFGICFLGRCIGFGKFFWFGGIFGRKLVVFINICGRIIEVVKLDNLIKI